MTRSPAVRPLASLVAVVVGVFLSVGASAAPALAAAGEISGQVVDSGATGLDGLTVILDDGSDPPAYQTTTTSGGGYFSFGPLSDGDYDVIVLGGPDLLDYDSGATSLDTTVPSSGELGQIVLDPGRRVTGIVRDAATGSPVESAVVLAISERTSQAYLALPPTDATGLYSLAVPPGDNYTLIALAGPLSTGVSGVDYDPQAWDHVNTSTLSSGSGCGCDFADLVAVDTTWPGPSVDDIDFDLLSYTGFLSFEVETVRGSSPYAGVHVFLERDSSGVGTGPWVPGADAVTDSSGHVALFSTDDGDYRLRFQVGGVDVGVLDAIDSGCGCGGSHYPLRDGKTKVDLGSYVKSSPGDGYFEGADVRVTFAVAGGAGGGGGGAPTGSPTPSNPSGMVGFVAPSATPTPTPTPTSAPTPSASPTAQPSASPTPTVAPVAAGDAGFPWWIVAIIVLLVAGAVLVVVLLRRR